MEKEILMPESSGYLDRIDAIENLSGQIENPDVKNAVLKCFKDSSYLVRCEAYDAFYGTAFQDVFDALVKRAKAENSKCAKMHALSALCGMTKQILPSDSQMQTVQKSCENEKNAGVRVAYFCFLYAVKKDEKYVDLVLKELNHRDYHVRCCVVNLLADVLDYSNKEKIMGAYKARLQVEDALAVKTSLEREIVRLSKGRVENEF